MNANRLRNSIGLPLLTLMLAVCLLLSLGGLARIISFIALSIFSIVNLSLLRLKSTSAAKPDFEVPVAVPASGALLCAAMIGYEANRIVI